MSIIYEIFDLNINAGGKTILSLNKLSLEDKKIHLISGPNGSGKTTLMKAMNNLIKINENTIFYKGKDIIKNNKIRHETIYLHQSSIALMGTVYDNICWGLKIEKIPKDEIDIRVKNIAKLIGITNLLNKNAYKLSGGELQKMAIARTIVLDKEVYLMDEPVSSLDKKSIGFIKDLMIELVKYKNKTIIYTTHQTLSDKPFADNIIELE